MIYVYIALAFPAGFALGYFWQKGKVYAAQLATHEARGISELARSAEGLAKAEVLKLKQDLARVEVLVKSLPPKGRKKL